LGAELHRLGQEWHLEIQALALFFVVDLAEGTFNGNVAGFYGVGAHEANDAKDNSDSYDSDLYGISYL
ncbi:MAG: hypothetical protein KC572_10470, partial [Gammaproteobacteria bacterium]|nr:hypothetical protein [Gammaproteobacteria bacterium]